MHLKCFASFEFWIIHEKHLPALRYAEGKLVFLQKRFTVADLEGEGGRNPPPHSRYRPPRKKNMTKTTFTKLGPLKKHLKCFTSFEFWIIHEKHLPALRYAEGKLVFYKRDLQ